MDSLGDWQRRVQALEPKILKAAWESRRAIVGPEKFPAGYEAAEEALALLRNGKMPTAAQLSALSLAIHMLRPAPLARAGKIEDLLPDAKPVFADWSQFQHDAAALLDSIGRIDRAPDTPIGTGFLVSADLLVTNRHVLDALTFGARALARGQAVVRFKHQYGSPAGTPIDIVDVAGYHTSLDIALLRIAPDATVRKPLVLKGQGAAVNDNVVAIGYPVNDPVRNPLFISALFGSRFEVQRAAPGQIVGVSGDLMYHDCTTLGGNSGSPLLAMAGAEVVGLHFEGAFMYRNGAIGVAPLRDFVTPHL